MVRGHVTRGLDDFRSYDAIVAIPNEEYRGGTTGAVARQVHTVEGRILINVTDADIAQEYVRYGASVEGFQVTGKWARRLVQAWVSIEALLHRPPHIFAVYCRWIDVQLKQCSGHL